MQDYYECTILADRAPTLRTIIRHGLDDCTARLEAMEREKSEAMRLKRWPKHRDSIPNQMYLEAKRIVRKEMFVLRMMRLQLEPRNRKMGAG